MTGIVYKIVPTALWERAVAEGRFEGAPVDLTDGYIHLSTAEQVRETAARHFSGQTDLLLVSIDARSLGEALRWEPSRGGALFPHLYAALDPDRILSLDPLPLGPQGVHLFPDTPA